MDNDSAVCAKCFVDEGIQEFIEDNATETECSYCKRRSKDPIAASMYEVLGLIDGGLHHEYDDPSDAGIPVEGGEYVFDTMSTREIFYGLDPITENEDVMEAILDAFRD